MKLNTTFALDSQVLFQTWTNSHISQFCSSHFRKQNKKQITAFMCINVIFALPLMLYLLCYLCFTLPGNVWKSLNFNFKMLYHLGSAQMMLRCLPRPMLEHPGRTKLCCARFWKVTCWRCRDVDFFSIVGRDEGEYLKMSVGCNS